MLATGNYVVLIGDTVRRVLFSRIEPGEERPEDRTATTSGDDIRAEQAVCHGRLAHE